MGVIEIRANIYFSTCGCSVNLYFEAIVDSKEQKIQGVFKGVNLKPRIEGQIGVYGISLLQDNCGDYFRMTVNDQDVINLTGDEDNLLSFQRIILVQE